MLNQNLQVDKLQTSKFTTDCKILKTSKFLDLLTYSFYVSLQS